MKILFLFLIFIKLGISYSQNYCMRFYGHGTGDIDRVKIPLDSPGKPINVGNGDFTIEFEMKALLSDNPKGGNAVEGANDDWTLGHVIIDRDIFGPGDFGDFGVALCNGKIAFGTNNGNQSRTIIGTTNVADNQWHHIAVTRQASNGEMRIYVDGTLDASTATGPTGNIAYRNGRTTSWPNDPFLVLGAEKHDYDNNNYPSYNGYLDELRISNVIRYSGASFTIPYLPFNTDSNTVALYHFDEGSGNILYDDSGFAGGPSNGQVNFGGSGTAGPVWVPRNTTPLQECFYLDHDINIFPNPFRQSFYISMKNSTLLKIKDIKAIECGSGKTISLQIAHLDNGFLKIESSEDIKSPIILILDLGELRFKKILISDNQ